jgi:TatD DNase family protein
VRPVDSAPLIDTHCHLVLLEDEGLLPAALEGAAAAGVTAIVSVGLNLDDSNRNRTIAETHGGVYFSAGWHPHEPKPPDSAQLRELDALLRHPRAVAVGEIGLDLFWRPGYHEVPLEVQLRSLRLMLDLAAEHRKPVLLHDRDAHVELLYELARLPEVRGVMHCFTGDALHAQRCAARGFVISFSGIVTFPNAAGIREAARAVAPDGFVVETDAPFLSPAPHRGKVNLPERVAHTAAEVARLREADVDGVRAQTTETARRVLGLDATELARAAG